MFLGLKVSIYDIKVASPIVLKGSLDYSLYILAYAIGLDHLSILFLRWCLEYLFGLFTPPPLYRTLITLYHHSLCFLIPVLIYKALSKPFSYINLYKKWPAFITLIGDAMFLRDPLKGSGQANKGTGSFDLLISVLRV